MRARSLGRRVSVRLRMVRRGRHGLGHGKGWACTRWRAGLRTVPSQRLGKPMLGCMPEEAKRRLNPLGVWRRSEAAGRRRSKALGSRCLLGSQALPLGKGRASSVNGVKRRKGRVRRGEGVDPRLCGVGAAAGGDPASRGHRPRPWLWWWLGEDGASVSAPSPSAWGQVSPSPHCSETPAPCLCRSTLRPCPASSALARPQPLCSAPRSNRGCSPGSRADGWTGGPGWAVSGEWASLRPSRAAGPISVLGRANWAGGRLRGASHHGADRGI